MTDSNLSVLTVRMMDGTEQGIPVEIQLGSKTVNKVIPNGRGLSKINVILNNNELSNAELVTEKI